MTTKKQLLAKMEEYRTKLDAASEKEWKRDLLIKDLERTIETLNEYIANLTTELDAVTEALNSRLEFEEKQLEIRLYDRKFSNANVELIK